MTPICTCSRHFLVAPRVRDDSIMLEDYIESSVSHFYHVGRLSSTVGAARSAARRQALRPSPSGTTAPIVGLLRAMPNVEVVLCRGFLHHERSLLPAPGQGRRRHARKPTRPWRRVPAFGPGRSRVLTTADVRAGLTQRHVLERRHFRFLHSSDASSTRPYLRPPASACLAPSRRAMAVALSPRSRRRRPTAPERSPRLDCWATTHADTHARADAELWRSRLTAQRQRNSPRAIQHGRA